MLLFCSFFIFLFFVFVFVFVFVFFGEVWVWEGGVLPHPLPPPLPNPNSSAASSYNPTHATCKAKTSQETQKSLMKFLEPTRKPKVIYTDNSLEFGKSCDELSWNQCTSTPHRSETNGIAERAVRRVKEETSAVLMQSGSDWRMVGGFHWVLLLSAKHSRSLVWWEDTTWKAVRNAL